MDSELIVKALNDACQDDKLNFQIVVQESILHIYINREVDSEPNYAQLINKISEILTTLNISWEGFWLYSRIMGEIEPDWQTYVEFQVYVSDNEPAPLIEETEDLIKEAKESLQDLKYLRDNDVLAVEELDEAILNKDSYLLVMESVEEIDNSKGDRAEDDIEDPFVVEELDASVLDKNSFLLIQESAGEIDNPTEEVEEDIIEDLFVVEELDDFISDKNSFLLRQEKSADKIDNTTREVEADNTKDLFVIAKLDDESSTQKSDSLAKESDNTVENIAEESEPRDIFTVEEVDTKVDSQEADNLAIDSNQKIDNSVASSIDITNFSEFCFVRNQRLLESEIVAPKLNIAYLVSFFHDLSQENKHLLLPLLTQHFKQTSEILDSSKEQFSPTIQEWLQKIRKLSPEQTRKAAIWFSRYCYNPEKTIAEIQIVFDNEAAKQEAERQAAEQSASLDRSQNNDNLNNSNNLRAYSSSTNKQHTHNYQSSQYLPVKTSLPEPVKEPQGLRKKITVNRTHILVPIIWTAVTLIFVIVGIISTNSNAINAAGIPAICENIINAESTDYCQLAVDMVGRQRLKEVSQEAIPFSANKEYIAMLTCEEDANRKAGFSSEEESSINNPVISSHGQEILRGIYFAEAKQKNVKKGGNNTVRVACIIANLNPEESPVIRASDIIPNNWPAEPYKGKSFLRQLQSLRQSLGIYSLFAIMGFSTLFTAIGLFIAAMCNWGITIYSLDILYKSAFILGVIEVIFSRLPITRLPMIGFLVLIGLQVLALGITSTCIKGFKLNWNDGYLVVGLGTVTVLGVRTTLHCLLILIVSAFIV